MSFLTHLHFKSVLSSNAHIWLANIYYSWGVAEVQPAFAAHSLELIHAFQLSFLCCMINILRQMKKILIQLMNRLLHFITQFIDWFDGLDESIFFFLVFFLEKTAFDLLAFLFITGWLTLETSGESASWITFV